MAWAKCTFQCINISLPETHRCHPQTLRTVTVQLSIMPPSSKSFSIPAHGIFYRPTRATFTLLPPYCLVILYVDCRLRPASDCNVIQRYLAFWPCRCQLECDQIYCKLNLMSLHQLRWLDFMQFYHVFQLYNHINVGPDYHMHQITCAPL